MDNATYNTLIADICSELGYHVAVGQTAKDYILLKDETGRYAFTLYLYEKNGWKLQAQLYWWSQGMKVYLKDFSRFDRYDKQEIQVSAVKSAKTIAKDIKRRLLDVYKADVDQAYDKLAERTAINNRCQDNTRKLAEIIGSKPSETNDQRVYDWVGQTVGKRVKVDATVGEMVDLKLEGLPHELAAEVLKLVSDRMNPPKGVKAA